MKKYLEIWELGKSFTNDRGTQKVVDGFNLTVEEGEFVCLIGHSGCGKSTVLSIVAGLAGPSAGTVILAGREVTGPGTDRGVVFQAPCLFPWMTALENVTLGLEQAFPALTTTERRERAAEHLERVGLGSALHKHPAELSQGMRQRVGLARAFALEPKMLLLDEPFGMLDSLTRLELQDALMEAWSRQRITALMVTHDVDEAIYLSSRVAMMTSGPGAKLGGILPVPFERPRDRVALAESAEYDRTREELIGFLERHAHQSAAAPAAIEAAPEEAPEESVQPTAIIHA
ncbi:MAG TPA: ABC transporter ATP-binding protein [Polyangiaceae bacterium]|nr:ABC transporter ATP-binding protein [Polyangiaceae bacterium]